MITESERKKLREVIGFRWISQINIYFQENEICNRYDQPYSTQYISLVFNGKEENEKVEKAIWDFSEEKMKKAAEYEARKKAIIANIPETHE